MRHTNPTLAALAAILLSGAAARAADLDGLARQLADSARAAGLRRVAIARIEPASGADDGRGEALAEALIVALVRDGRVQTVERGQLGKLAEEVNLDRTGAVPGASEREVRLAPIDALVIGRYEAEDGRLRVFARVVEAQTGVIVGAAAADVAAPSAALYAARAPMPSADETLRDAPREPGPSACGGAAVRATTLQEDVLDLKARYWALRLRLGEDDSAAARSVESTIPDSDQRELFTAQLRAWRAADQIPPMSAAELSRLTAADRDARQLVADCGL